MSTPYNLSDTYARGPCSLTIAFPFASTGAWIWPNGFAGVGFTHPLFSWRVGDSTLSYLQQTAEEPLEMLHAIV